MTKSLLMKNIGRLVTMEPAAGKNGKLGIIEDALVFVRDGTIEWIGKSNEFPKNYDVDSELDCKNKVVLPGLIDCHTHLVYAGSRENEFRMRSEGATYQEIARAGGGIISTVKATRNASEKELLNLALKRADEALMRGVTTVEIKSGYGLDFATEEKILKVAQALGKNHKIDVLTTFLGAHVVPPEYKEKRADYLSIVINEMLPSFANAGLCNFCDIFVEEGAYTSDEAKTLANAAHKHGLKMRLHVDQFADHGGGELAAEINAISADHLDYVSDKGILAMAKAKVSAVLLPTAAFFAKSGKFAPARKMIDEGLNVAISTDFNPGTSPTLDLLLCATMGVTQMGMTTDEALMAITINAAKSLGIEDKVGSIDVGKKADLVVFDAPNEDYLLYRFSTNFVSEVVKSGRILGMVK